MHVTNLELTNFRNYENLNIDFDKYTNIFYGDNAQGKTNILESIYLGGTTKSHRLSKDKEIIRFGASESHIRINLLKNNVPYKIDMHLRKNKSKSIAINGTPIKKAAQLLGILNIVFFSPEDLSIIKNGPSERRRFIDMELCQLDTFYLHDLSNYNKAVNQRNKLLKDMYEHRELGSVLDVWDEQIINYGRKIIKARQNFVDELNDIIYEIHKKLTGYRESCRIIYDPDVNFNDYPDLLKRNRDKDIRYKTTSVGPHRDDLIFIINNNDVRKYGSQGQQRTAALSLKLSEIEIVKNVINDTPVLLLDDVLSELDSSRRNYLLESIGNIQTLITCTGLDEFVNDRFTVNKIFKVISGTVNGD